MYRHFILTRFNLALWSKDKNNRDTRTAEWLEQRFQLFETFCLPSVSNQSEKGFKWIVLFGSDTPDSYREKIDQYAAQCKMFVPYFISPLKGRFFASIFKNIVASLSEEGDTIVTTYLDNDDALHKDYAKEVKRLSAQAEDKTFISFVYGLQYFTRWGIATRVKYSNNHFISLVEKHRGDEGIRTVFGYGSRIYVGKHEGTHTLYVDDPRQPKWAEIIHDTNMGNDIMMTFYTHLVTDRGCMRREYGTGVTMSAEPRKVFYTRFLPKACSEVVRHVRLRITGRKWI